MRVAIAVLLAALAAVPAFAKPEIKGIQASHGQLGPERKNIEYVLGDEVYFRFTVAGFTTDKDGRLAGELAMSVLDAKGKEILKKDFPIQQVLALGGGTFPGQVSLNIEDDMPLGEYSLKVTITDNLARESDSFERKFTCKAQEFALVAVRFSQDAEGRIPATVGGLVSQTLFLKARGIGFDRSKGELDVEMTIQVFDLKGNPVMPKPIRKGVHNEDPKFVKAATVINLRGELTLNREGEFVLKVSLTDKVAKKTVAFEAPLKVTKP